MPAEVVIYTKEPCRSCRLAKEFLAARGVEYREVLVTADPSLEREMMERSGGAMTAPQILVGGQPIGGYDAMLALDEQGARDALLFPERASSAQSREKEKTMSEDKVREVVIIGSGCSGLTSAIYTARANLAPLVVEGREAGGQLSITTDVENYPGFPEGVMGPDLVENMKKQAERFGTQYLRGDVTKADFSEQPFKLWVEDDETPVLTKTVIIATGASARMLGLEGEMDLVGHGLSTCATCDGFFFRDKEIAVVGGGDSAMEEATFLTRFASKVSIIHRREELRASKIMQERAFDNPKIEFVWNSVVDQYLSSEGRLTGLRLHNVKTDETTDLAVDGCFLGIGHIPNTEFLKGQIDLEPNGYLKVHGHTRTSCNGVFGAGDVHDQHYRQAVTAAGMGCMAAIDCEKWLEAGGISDEDWAG